MSSQLDLQTLAPEVESLRNRINTVRRTLAGYFVGKQDVIDLMCVAMLAQEPLLIVGQPGTAKSDLVVKFCQALGLGGEDYFEYMLTKFTEPGEIIGPVDINQLKEGRYLRKTGGKLPECRIAFLDEIFKSNSAILNTLLTIINERKFYQDGQPVPVRMVMLFAATNEIPDFDDLSALRDRFALKIESRSVSETHFSELIGKGIENEARRVFNQKPWADLASLDDFLRLKSWFDHTLLTGVGHRQDGLHDPAFPAEIFALFKRILRTLVRENKLMISDRKTVKLYKLVRAQALLLHGGVVTREDLRLLRYIPDQLKDFEPVASKVDSLLALG